MSVQATIAMGYGCTDQHENWSLFYAGTMNLKSNLALLLTAWLRLVAYLAGLVAGTMMLWVWHVCRCGRYVLAWHEASGCGN